MQVKITDDYLMVVAETEFEEEYLGRFRDCPGKKIAGFLKCGVTPADIVGLVVRQEKAWGPNGENLDD